MKQPSHRAYVVWAIAVTLLILAIVAAWALEWLGQTQATLMAGIVFLCAAVILWNTERGR